jgi:gas vesicle protein
LFGSFGVVVGLMLVLGVAAIVELGSVDNRAQYLGTNSVPAAQTIGTIETAAASFRRVASRPTWWWPALVGEIQGETHRTVSVVTDGPRQTEDGAVVVDQTRQAFQEIGAAVTDMAERIDHIATASNEVATVSEQSSASTQQVSAATEETSASAEEIAASAQELAATAQELAATAQSLEPLVAQFRL